MLTNTKKNPNLPVVSPDVFIDVGTKKDVLCVTSSIGVNIVAHGHEAAAGNHVVCEGHLAGVIKPVRSVAVPERSTKGNKNALREMQPET